MLKLKDVPNFILENIKNSKSITADFLNNAFKDNLNILTNIKNLYQLSDLDILKSIRLNIEFEKHICKTCGDTVHYSRRLKNFPSYCSMSCMSKNKDVKAKVKATNLIKYGSVSPLANKDVKAKTLKTIKEKYGVDNVAKNINIKSKIAKTNIDKYGFKTPSENIDIKNKIIKTNNIKYGGNAPIVSKDIKDKISKTNTDKYGCECVLKNKDIKNKIAKTNIKRYGVANPFSNKAIKDKIIKTNMDRYGCACALSNPDIKAKALKTIKEKYGVDNYSQSYDHKIKNIEDNYSYIINNFKDAEVEPLFTEEEYKAKGGRGYKNIYKWKCKKCGNVFEGYYANAMFPICRHCHPVSISKPQEEIINYIKSIIKSEIKINDRNTIDPFELDIYIPELKLAIEFNGGFWHGLNCEKDKTYHLNKTEQCEAKGIHLIHIFEHEWSNKKDIVKSRLCSLISSASTIYARTCEVKIISNKIKSEFITDNHLQGDTVSKINLGLFHNNELVATMTFGKPRFNKNYEWELLRFCNKLNYRVIGGASKLLKYFERNYKPKSLISYANRCWSKGDLYFNLNFSLIDKSEPSYFYVKHNIILSRYQCQKHKLKNILLDKYDESKTESENMSDNGFNKIYDCGNLIFMKEY